MHEANRALRRHLPTQAPHLLAQALKSTDAPGRQAGERSLLQPSPASPQPVWGQSWSPVAALDVPLGAQGTECWKSKACI